MSLAEKSRDTRFKLLTVAAEVFARKGFQDAGVREICQQAGANQAAVNYHFGGKLELYKAVLAFAFENAKPLRPMPRLADDPTHPTEQLHKWIVWNAERMLGEGGHLVYELIVNELREPTPALDELLERSMQPIYNAGVELIAAVLGKSRESTSVELCCMSVFGQCLVYRHARPMIERWHRQNHSVTRNGKKAPQSKIDQVQGYLQYEATEIACIANHIADFSLAGIRAQRKSNGKKSSPS